VKLDLGRTVGILANAGVLLGILLLVYELHQNRQMMQSQVRNSISETLVNVLVNQAGDPDLTEIYLKSENGEELTPNEARRLYTSWVATFRYWENVNFQYRNGLYDEGEYSAQREAWREILTEPGVRDMWCQRRHRQSPEFGAEIETLLGENGCN